ncbi:hypothetical protein [Cryobacterium sp. AP23]
MSETKSANAVSTFRWESLKREFFMRTHRGEPVNAGTRTAPAAKVADPNAE